MLSPSPFLMSWARWSSSAVCTVLHALNYAPPPLLQRGRCKQRLQTHAARRVRCSLHRSAGWHCSAPVAAAASAAGLHSGRHSQAARRSKSRLRPPYRP